MIDALADAARAIEASRETRVAILSGEGKAFCAGGDIAAWGGLPPLDMWRDWTRAGHRAFEALARLRVPLIAALTGHAFGGGLELAAVADIRIAERGIKLGLPETGPRHGAGLVGHATSGAPLRRRRWCAAWRWRGACSPPRRRLRSASSTRWSRAGEGLTRADALAADIAKRGPLAVQIVKAMINAAEGEDRDAPIEGLAGRADRDDRRISPRASPRFATSARRTSPDDRRLCVAPSPGSMQLAGRCDRARPDDVVDWTSLAQRRQGLH